MNGEVWCRVGSQTAIFLINLFLCQDKNEPLERGLDRSGTSRRVEWVLLNRGAIQFAGDIVRKLRFKLGT
jgi:hypothetical protein